MCATAMPSDTSIPAASDQPFVVHGVTWQSYLTLRATLDIPGLRLTYLKGALELMSPSSRHEELKKIIARLLEFWAIETGTVLSGYGSTTFRSEAAERGLEPDECYVVGDDLESVPDIAIEVVLTSGGIPKLDVYRGLGVPEVWFYQDENFHIFRLGEHGYEPAPASLALPALDFALLARCVRLESQTKAVLALRDALRQA